MVPFLFAENTIQYDQQYISALPYLVSILRENTTPKNIIQQYNSVQMHIGNDS